MHAIAELERELGSPNNLVIDTTDKEQALQVWASLKGYNIFKLTTPQLVNLYHENADLRHETPALYHAELAKPTELQLLSAQITEQVLKIVGTASASPDLIRQIVREEIGERIQRIEIVAPAHRITLDGPLHYLTEKVIRIAALGHPIMLVGPAGCGKTTIGQHVARALGLQFRITSTINDTHELSGFVDGHGVYHRTPFREAFEHGGVWVADEIDAWDAAALLAANSALANGVAVFPDAPQPINRHPDFRVIATANTFGNGADRIYVGRNELDAASTDRFATLNVDYDINLEQHLAGGMTDWLRHVWNTRKRVNEKKIRHVVSTRAIIMGQAALAAGISWDDTVEYYLLKGMNESDRRKIC